MSQIQEISEPLNGTTEEYIQKELFRINKQKKVDRAKKVEYLWSYTQLLALICSVLIWLVLESVSECRVSCRWIGPQWDQIQDVWILNMIWMGNPTEAIVSRDTEWVSVGVCPPRRRDEHWVRDGGKQVVKAAAFTTAPGMPAGLLTTAESLF